MGPTPETPSTRFDHTVSSSLPIGVTNPMPVTATRRCPFEFEFMTQKITDVRAKTCAAAGGKTRAKPWTPCPSPSDQLAHVQGELQAQPQRGLIQARPQEL